MDIIDILERCTRFMLLGSICIFLLLIICFCEEYGESVQSSDAGGNSIQGTGYFIECDDSKIEPRYYWLWGDWTSSGVMLTHPRNDLQRWQITGVNTNPDLYWIQSANGEFLQGRRNGYVGLADSSDEPNTLWGFLKINDNPCTYMIQNFDDGLVLIGTLWGSTDNGDIGLDQNDLDQYALNGYTSWRIWDSELENIIEI